MDKSAFQAEDGHRRRHQGRVPLVAMVHLRVVRTSREMKNSNLLELTPPRLKLSLSFLLGGAGSTGVGCAGR